MSDIVATSTYNKSSHYLFNVHMPSRLSDTRNDAFITNIHRCSMGGNVPQLNTQDIMYQTRSTRATTVAVTSIRSITYAKYNTNSHH